MKEDNPLNTERAAAYLGIAIGTLYNLVHAKKITYYRPSGKLIFFRWEYLDAFVYQNRKLADFEVNEQAESLLNRR